MMDDKPYKIVWKKIYDSGEHVHYEQYTERENAEARMDELLRVYEVDAKLYYPDRYPVVLRKY